MTPEQINEIEQRATDLKKTMEIEVQTVLDLCAAAKSTDDAITAALRQTLAIGEPDAMASYATVGGVGALLKNAREGIKRIHDQLHGTDGALKRMADAEAAARAAWRDRMTLEQDIALMLRMLEAVRPRTDTESPFDERLANLDVALADFYFYRKAMVYRYRALKDASGKWKDGRGGWNSSDESVPSSADDQDANHD